MAQHESIQSGSDYAGALRNNAQTNADMWQTGSACS